MLPMIPAEHLVRWVKIHTPDTGWRDHLPGDEKYDSNADMSELNDIIPIIQLPPAFASGDGGVLGVISALNVLEATVGQEGAAEESKTELIILFDRMVDVLICEPNSNMCTYAMNLYGYLRLDQLEATHITAQAHQITDSIMLIHQLLMLFACIIRGQEHNDAQDASDAYETALQRCSQLNNYFRDVLLRQISMSLILKGTTKRGLEFYSTSLDDKSELYDIQIYEAMIQAAFAAGLRWFGNTVYSRVTVPDAMTGDPIRTTSFNQVPSDHEQDELTNGMSLEIYIASIINRETMYQLWTRINESTLRHAITRLKRDNPKAFPRVKKTRHLHGFANGVFNTQDCHFTLYGDSPSTSAPCKFHDVPFDPQLIEILAATNANNLASDDDFTAFLALIQSIECPGWDTILKTQEPVWNAIPCNRFPGVLVRDWFFIMMGRALLPKGDDWQVALWMVGQGGTGKSELLKAMHAVFDHSDIYTINNIMQDVFGYANGARKYLVLLPEVKDNLNLDQGMFQSFVANDAVSLAIKNVQETLDLPFFEPNILMASNTIPSSWVSAGDQGGSLQRRVIMLDFPTRPAKAEQFLGVFETNVAPFLVKSALMFLYTKAYMAFKQCDLRSLTHTQILITSYHRLVHSSIIKFFNTQLEVDDTGGVVSFEELLGRYFMTVTNVNLRRTFETYSNWSPIFESWRLVSNAEHTPVFIENNKNIQYLQFKN